MIKKLYIAGPMTGYEEYNFPAFYEAEKKLIEKFNDEYMIINPARMAIQTHFEYEDYMRNDLPMVASCHAICMLDGWEKSKGACVEAIVARAVGCKFYEMWSSGLIVEHAGTFKIKSPFENV